MELEKHKLVYKKCIYVQEVTGPCFFLFSLSRFFGGGMGGYGCLSRFIGISKKVKRGVLKLLSIKTLENPMF